LLREIVARHKTVVLLLLGLQLVRGVFYGAVVPPWQAPDEPWHYAHILWVSRPETAQESGTGSEPVLSAEMEKSLRAFNFWRFHRTDTPEPGVLTRDSLRHTSLLGAHEGFPTFHPLLLTPLHELVSPLDVTARLLILRLPAVLLGMGVIFLAFLAAATIFPEEDALIAGIPAFVTFLPMHTFMNSVLNSDNLVEFWASLALFLMLTWFRNGLSPWRVLGATVAVTLSVLSKRTALFLIPTLLFAIVLCARRWIPWEKKRWAVWLAAPAILVSLACLGLFIFYVGPHLQGGLLASFAPSFRTDIQGDFFNAFLKGSHAAFLTFWAGFGWSNVTLAWGWYKVLAAISLVVAGGFVLYLLRLYRGAGWAGEWQAEAILFLLVALFLSLFIGLVATIAVSGYRSGLHARYFFPAIIPIATFFLLGWRELFPPGYRRFAVPGCLAALALLDAMAMGYYIIPFFYS
jgi:4-amino-4-deoxy-L-arabinose transferase-like glycosyltransferase